MSIEGVNMSIVQRCMSIKEVYMSYEIRLVYYELNRLG